MNNKKFNSSDTDIIPWRIALVYFFFAAAWILLSDTISIAYFPSVVALSTFQTAKGLLFVASTAFLLYFLIRRDLKILRKQKMITENIISSSMDAILLTSPDGAIQAANPAACNLFNRTEEEICGIGRSGLMDFKDERLPQLLRERRSKGKVFGEIRMVKKDGTIFPAEFSSSIFIDPDGKQRTSIIIRDISERLKIETQLKNSEEKFESIFENAPFPSTLSSAVDGRIIEVNKQFEKIFGFSKAEVIGKTSLELGFNPDQNLRMKILTLLKENGSVRDVEMKLFTKEKQEKIMLVNLDILEFGGNKFILNTTEDITERKRAEEALHISDERFRAIALNTPDHILMQDHELRYQFVINPQLGLTEAMMIGKTDLEILPGEDVEKLTAVKKKILETGEPYHIEVALKNLKGEPEYFEGSYVPSFDNKGKTIGLIGYFRNITESKRAEEALRESNQRLKKVLEVETVGVMFWDLTTGCLIDANDTFLNIMGYTRDDVDARILTWQKLTPPEYYDVSMAEIKKFQVSGRVGPYEKEYLRKDGTKQWFVFAGSSLGNNQCVEFCVDISDRKNAEQLLRDSEEKLRMFIEHAPASLAMFDKEMRYLAVSKRWLADYKLENMNPINRSHYDIFPEIPQTWKEVHQRGMNGEVVINEEDIFMRVDGKIQWLRWEVRPWFSNNKIGGIVIFTEDITDRKNAEEESRKLSNKLIESEEIMRKAASQQLHDHVGQNLTALTINLNYVATQLLPETQTKVKERLNDSINILNETIEQIRDIMVELRPSVLDDYGLIAAMNWLCSKFMERTEIRVEFEGKELQERLPLNIEQTLFRIIQEIFHNISKHSKAKNVLVKMKEDENKLYLSVKDDGVGFDYEKHKTQRDKKGLGLSSMEERIKLIKGKMKIESKPGKGSMVTIEV